VPIIIVTAYSERDYFMRAIELGVDRYVTKPVDTNILLRALQQSARQHFQQRDLAQARQSVVDALSNTIAVLSRAIEMRDPYTDGHQKRVSLLADAIATEMQLPEKCVTGIRLGSLVHDLGKISVPAEVLSTPRKLSAPELSMIRSHPRVGHDILSEASFPWPLAQMVLEHHERMDGSGYPSGLKDRQISIEARIIAVADVVEAMSSHRPYRAALGIDAAMKEISSNRGRLYDAEVVDACLRVLERRQYQFWD
jgi:HD-GYP domain-containing protein (c-di-GMP phosphodiesterase class II)